MDEKPVPDFRISAVENSEERNFYTIQYFIQEIQITCKKTKTSWPSCKKENSKHVICLPPEHQEVTRTRSEMSLYSKIKLKFGNVGF